MSKKLFLLISFVVVVGFVGSAAAVDKTWLGNSTDWFDGANWNPAGVPEAAVDQYTGDVVHINGGVSNYPIISTSDPCAVCKKLWLGSVADSGDAYLTIESGGELTIRSYNTDGGNQTFVLGTATGTGGTLTMNGGTINMTPGETLEIGGRSSEGNGTFNMNGGNFNNGEIRVPGFSCVGEATLNLDGGIIDCNIVMFPGDAQPGYGILNVSSGSLICDYMGFYFGLRFNLYGGVIDSDDFKMWGTDGVMPGLIPQPQMDIYEGIWINRSQLPGAAKGRKATYDVRYYIARDDVVAYGGRGNVVIEWTNMNHPDPNQRIVEDDLEALMDRTDPNNYDPNVIWWVRADMDPNIVGWPDPVSGFGAASPEQMLTWYPAYSGCAAFHDVYFGTSFDDVNDATLADPCGVYITRLPADQNYIARVDYWPESLQMGPTYYWRIDGVNDADPCSPWKGPVWNFSISYVPIEDFESYTGDLDLKATWSDNSDPENSTYCYAYLKTDQALDAQSMWLNCWNNYPPYYGEVWRNFTTPQDWSPTATDARLLALSYLGKADSGDAGIYVKLKDSLGTEATQWISKDPDTCRVTSWTEHLLALNAFTDVDLSKISRITIGVCTDPIVSAGLVKIWVDDIRLYLPECNPAYRRAPGDINGNCTTDLRDLDIMVAQGNWLTRNWDVTVAAPANDPCLWYEFDGDVNDSSVNGYDGTLIDVDGVGEYSAGYAGQALVFDADLGEPTRVDVPLGAFSTISRQVTVSLWMNGDTTAGVQNFCGGLLVGGQTEDRELMVTLIGKKVGATIGNNGDPNSRVIDSINKTANDSELVGQWNHWAVTKDCDTEEMKIYINGHLFTQGGNRSVPLGDITIFTIGAHPAGEEGYQGSMDDFRIYDYALSQGEICSLAGETVGSTFVQSLQQLLVTGYDINLNDDGVLDVIDFKDFAVLADTWLETWLFGE